MNTTELYIESRARAICQQREINDLETFLKVKSEVAHREFLSETQPFLKLKSDVMAFDMPSIILHADGTIMRGESTLSQSAKDTLKQIDENIQQIAERYKGFTR